MTSNLMHMMVVQLKMALRKRYEQCLLHLQERDLLYGLTIRFLN